MPHHSVDPGAASPGRFAGNLGTDPGIDTGPGDMRLAGFGAGYIGNRVEQLIEAAAGLLGATGFGLMMLDDRQRLRCVGTSDEGGQTLAAAQLRHRAGPGWDALRTARTVAVPDLAGDPRYAGLATVTDPPARAVLAVPLRVAGHRVGALLFYRQVAAPWTEDQCSGATAIAGVLSALLVDTVQSRHR